MSGIFGAVVVAAGAGTRLASEQPKALAPLGGTALVRRAVDAMNDAGAGPIVVVIQPGYRESFAEAVAGCKVTALVEGGLERTHSVRNGLHALAALPPQTRPEYVVVHDAARPLVPAVVTGRVIGALQRGAPAVVPVIQVTDSIRRVTGDGSVPVDRRELRSVQTPQGFDRNVLMDAYRRIGDHVVSDDAGVCEQVGYPITLVDGAVESLKITHRSDLVAAAAMLEDSTSTVATNRLTAGGSASSGVFITEECGR